MATRPSKSKGKSKKKGGSVSVNFEGVESGGRVISDGKAHGKIIKAELTESKAGNEMFNIQIEATKGKEKARVFEHLVLTPNALWKIKNLLEAAGVEVPEEEMEISEEMLEGLEFGIEIVNEDFEGRDQPRVVGFFTEGEESEDEEESDDDSDDEDEDEDEEEDEKPSKKSKAKSKKASKDDDDEDEEEESDEDEEDEDSDDDEEESEDDDEDEDEEEDEKPSKKSKSKKSAPKLRAGQKVTFKDDKDKVRKGVITSIDDDEVLVEDTKGDEWTLEPGEIELVK